MIEVVSEQEARTTQSPYHGSITEEITVPEAEMVALAKGKTTYHKCGTGR